ncbi:hypothetical protein LAZ67_2001456 [Cordylochernes scorpioides]|uniref:RNA-directed DNA polymerase n=1 Tax=Cordylochernes scorpioides TaxID=51811 RepID=A0ABY6K196_9ARAC|nr:hypothetical protein LAZ67_2001456 [Cordylochernes scorpioides]
MVSDNASIFTGDTFSNYCLENGIRQNFITPGHPATNGLAERNVQTLKNKLKSMINENVPIHQKIQRILLRYRATPLASGRSPSEMYLNRQIRIKLDAMRPYQEERSQQQIQPRTRFLQVGERVQARVFISNKQFWKNGTIKEKLGNLHYIIELDEGKSLKRHINQLQKVEIKKKQVTFDESVGARFFTVVKALLESVITIFGVPKTILSDRGSAFISCIFKGICKAMGVSAVNTTAWRPQSNGAVERLNRTVIESLRRCEASSNWDDILPMVALAIRTTEHSSTGFTPAKLVFGHELRLPQPFQEAGQSPVSEDLIAQTAAFYERELTEEVEKIREVVRQTYLNEQEEARIKFENKRLRTFNNGDLVLVERMHETKGRHKFEPRYGGPYEVLRRAGDTVYILKNLETGNLDKYHIDRLKQYHIPIRIFPTEEEETSDGNSSQSSSDGDHWIHLTGPAYLPNRSVNVVVPQGVTTRANSEVMRRGEVDRVSVNSLTLRRSTRVKRPTQYDPYPDPQTWRQWKARIKPNFPLNSSSQEETKRYRLNFMQDGGFVLAMPYSLGYNGATLVEKDTEKENGGKSKQPLQKFNGSKSAIRPESWIKLYDFENNSLKEDEKIKNLMYYLTDSALEWYADEIISNPAIKRWEVVKEKLIQRFGSYNANPIVSASHRRLKREESIENYFQDKIRLLNQTHLTKEEKNNLLTDGLPNDWKDLIVAAQPTDTTKWFHIAASIEQNRASIQFKPKNKIHLATKNNDNRKNVCPFWCPICSKKGIKIKHWVTDCEDYDPNYKKDRPNQNTSVKQVCGAPELLNVSTLTNTPTQGAFKLINISVEVNGIPAQAFVDTGATVSIINWRLFKRTRLQLQPNSDIHISQADGVTRTCGSLQTKVRIDKLIKPVTLHVMKNFKYPLLIGLDVASLFNLLIDAKDKTIYTKFDGLQNPILVNHLEEIREHELKELLEHNRNVFSQHAIDLGKVAIQHKIITKSEQPISLRPYRRPLKEYEEIAEQVKELLEHKLIRTSDSPWAFPVVMVPKKDGNKRMCIDYRRLNEITLDDRQPLPHIQDMFDRLHGSRFFSTLDVAWGFWQIEMDPQSIQKTAFVTNDDASKYGIGAILTQIGPDNEEHVIAYYSKTLQPHQENYSAYEMECLAVIQATDHFHVYIENQPFEIITNHAALQWLFTMKKPKPKYFRWILSLSSKSCNIVHRSGKQQTHVDALSRLPVVNIATQELQEHQQNSDLSFLKNSHTHDGVIMIKQKGVFKAVVPNSLAKKILEEYHDSLSHPSITKTCKLITQCYWWKGITTDIKNYVRSCKSCQLVKVRHEPTLGEMITPTSNIQPLKMIGCDTIVLGTAAANTKHKFIQVFVDHATRYLWAYPTITNTAQAVTQCLDKIIKSVNSINTILTDNGKNFISKEFNKFLSLQGIKHTYTSPYHPQCNGICEKLNDTIMTKLRIAVLEKPRCKWSTLLPQVVKNYNSTPHDVTGFSPLFLMYGIGNVPEFADQTPITIEEARKKASLRTEQSRSKWKIKHDSHHPKYVFKEGDLVIRKIAFNDPRLIKTSPKYEGPFVIQKKISDVTNDISERPKASKTLWSRQCRIRLLIQLTVMGRERTSLKTKDDTRMEHGCLGLGVTPGKVRRAKVESWDLWSIGHHGDLTTPDS